MPANGMKSRPKAFSSAFFDIGKKRKNAWQTLLNSIASLAMP